VWRCGRDRKTSTWTKPDGSGVELDPLELKPG
jgi:hypothetical protein